MAFYSERDFHRCRGIGGRAMRDRQNSNERFAVGLTLDRERDDARAILAAFFLTALRFVIPYIGIRNNQARLGRRNCHPPRYFGSSRLLR